GVLRPGTGSRCLLAGSAAIRDPRERARRGQAPSFDGQGPGRHCRTVSGMSVTFRDLKTLDEFAQVVELERVIWGPGYVDVVPVPIFAITVMRGGVLIGAFDGVRMIGFVYSIAGIKQRRPTQWSHMLGVIPEFRNDGTGHRLKLLQRDRALAMGLDLIE